MPIKKCATHAPKPEPDPPDEIVACDAEATRRIEERDQLAEKRRPLVAHYNAFVEALTSLRAVRGDMIARHLEGDPGPLEVEKALNRELDRTAKELNALAHAALYPIALLDETIEAATLRVAIERGIKPTQWAKLQRPEMAGDQVNNSNERRDAREVLEEYLPRYREDLETYKELVRLARMRDLPTLHRMRRYTFNASYPIETAIEEWEREIARLETVIERATPRRGRPKKVEPPAL
jgi:hypothetical protein